MLNGFPSMIQLRFKNIVNPMLSINGRRGEGVKSIVRPVQMRTLSSFLNQLAHYTHPIPIHKLILLYHTLPFQCLINMLVGNAVIQFVFESVGATSLSPFVETYLGN